MFKVWGFRRDFGLFGAVRARARMLAPIRLFRMSVALFGRRTAPSRVGNKPKPARSVQCRREPCQVTWGISVVAPKTCVDFARGRKTIITNHCVHITAAIQDCAQQHNSTAHRHRDIRHPTLTPLLPHFYPTFTPRLPHFYPTFTPLLPHAPTPKCRVKPPNVRVSVFVRAGTRATGRVKAHLPHFYPTLTPLYPTFTPIPAPISCTTSTPRFPCLTCARAHIPWPFCLQGTRRVWIRFRASADIGRSRP